MSFVSNRPSVSDYDGVSDTVNVEGEVITIHESKKQMRNYTDNIPEEDIVLLRVGQTMKQKLISKVPFISVDQEFTLFVDDASEFEEGDIVEAEVEPVWRGYNTFKSSRCGKPVSIVKHIKDGESSG